MTTRQQQLLLLTTILAAVLIAGASILVTNNADATIDTGNAIYNGLTRRTTSDGAPILGNPAAPLTLVEFIDYACPHCATYRPTINQFITDYVRTGQARYELRILVGLDPAGSRQAARAALCAGEQNAFWEMHDTLLTYQTTYGRTAFTDEHIQQAADNLGLNSSDLLSCIDSPARYTEALQSSISLALSLDVQTLPALLIREGNGRPTWPTLDGEPLTGGLSYPTLMASLEAQQADD